MPDMDGKELCRKIRALDDKEKSSLPVVVITAVVSTEDQEEYRAAGMDGFVPKPFEEKTLINIIMEVTDHHETKEREGEAGRRAMADSDL